MKLSSIFRDSIPLFTRKFNFQSLISVFALFTILSVISGCNEAKSTEAFGVDPGGELGCPSTFNAKGTVCHAANDAIGAGLAFQQECERLYTCAKGDPACTKTVSVTQTTETAKNCETNKKEYSCKATITCKQ